MVFVVQVRGVGRVSGRLKAIEKQIPVASDKAAYNIARFAAKQLKIQASMSGLQPWGGGAKSIFRDTKARRLAKGRFAVFMPIHGIWQDRARPHWVSIKPWRKVARWAEDRGFKGRSFYFKPRHFIPRAINDTRRKVLDIFSREIRRTIKEAR